MMGCNPYNLFCNFVNWLFLVIPPLAVFIVTFILGRRIGGIVPNALLRWVFFFLALFLSCGLSASWWPGLNLIDINHASSWQRMSIAFGWLVQMSIGGIAFGQLFGGRSKVNLRKPSVSEESKGKEKGGESKKIVKKVEKKVEEIKEKEVEEDEGFDEEEGDENEDEETEVG